MQRNGFRLPGGAVHHGEEVSEPKGGRQGAHQVLFDLVEMPLGDQNRRQGGFGIMCTLNTLTGQTEASPGLYITPEAGPDKCNTHQLSIRLVVHEGSEMEAVQQECRDFMVPCA